MTEKDVEEKAEHFKLVHSNHEHHDVHEWAEDMKNAYEKKAKQEEG